MARDSSKALAAWLAALLLGACSRAPPPQIVVGDRAPAVVTRAVSAEIVIAWISRPEDYLACRSPAAVLRQLQRRYDGRLKIAAVAVAGDPRLAAAFVHAERLDATVVPISLELFEREFAASPLPGLYVIRDGRVVRAWTSGVTLNVVSGEPSQLSLAIQHLMESPGGTALTYLPAGGGRR
jgi:hypothetical protein